MTVHLQHNNNPNPDYKPPASFPKNKISKEASKHLYDILREALRHPAIGVYLKDEGTITLFFDGCCECDIEITDYTDLRMLGK